MTTPHHRLHDSAPARSARLPYSSAIVSALLCAVLLGCGGGGGGGGAPGKSAGAPSEAQVGGTLVDGLGEPAADVRVVLDNDPAKVVFSNAEGRFSISAIAGPHTLVATLGSLVLHTEELIVPTKKKKAVDVELGELQVLASLTGRSVDGMGASVPDAKIEISGPVDAVLYSDEEGNFSAQLAAGSYSLTPSWQGYKAPGLSIDLTLNTPPTALAAVVLYPVTGVFYDAFLQPLEGLTVHVQTVPEVITTTDADGVFDAQAPIGTFPIVVLQDGLVLYEEVITTDPFAAYDLGQKQVLVNVTGRVIDDSLAPVAGAELVVDTAPITISQTEADGTFNLDLPAREFQLCIRLNSIIVNTQLLMLAEEVGMGTLSLGEIVANSMDDIDGDGLGNDFETMGWTILVDELGQGNVTQRTVYGDPLDDDGDGDGLTDDEEFGYKTDPGRADSDGDLLDDPAELFQYLSHPTLVDTDGDAMPLGSDGSDVPNPAFFDGNEVVSLKTSPTLDDTDGDGVRDREEIIEGGTSARMADLPSISIEIFGQPIIGFEGDETLMQSTIQTAVKTDNVSSKKTKEFNFKTEASLDTMVKVQGKKSWPGGFSASVEAEATLKASVNTDYSHHASSEALADLKTVLNQEQSSTTEYTAGKIEAAVEVSNESDITVRYSDLEILVFQIDPSLGVGGLKPLGKLNPLEGEEGESVLLGPQGSVTLFRENTDLDLLRIRDYMRNPSGLYFRIGDFSLFQLDDQGNAVLDYDVVAQNIAERTGLISIDWGDGRFETHNVATNVERALDGTPLGLTMVEALDLLGYDSVLEEAGEDSGDVGVPNKAGQLVLTRLEGTANVPIIDQTTMEEVGASRYWLVQGPDTVDFATNTIKNFDEIRIGPGDAYYLQFVTDLDQDGLTLQQESVLGTNDLLADTDADGVTDFDEVVTGWPIKFNPINACALTPAQVNVLTYTVRSNPRFGDIDNDGVFDGQERENFMGCVASADGETCDTMEFIGTNPFLKDTDYDGQLDSVDSSNDPCDAVGGPAPTGGPIVELAMAKSTYAPAGKALLDQTEFGNNAFVRRSPAGIVDDLPAVNVIQAQGSGLEWTSGISGQNKQATRFVNDAPGLLFPPFSSINATSPDAVLEILRRDDQLAVNPPRMIAVNDGQGWTWAIRLASPASGRITQVSSAFGHPFYDFLSGISGKFVMSQPGFAALSHISSPKTVLPNGTIILGLVSYKFRVFPTPGEVLELDSPYLADDGAYRTVIVRAEYTGPETPGGDGETTVSLWINGAKHAEVSRAGSMDNPSPAKGPDSESLWVGTYDYDPALTADQNFLATENTLGIGEYGTGMFNGSIDDVRVWDRPLTDAEIGDL